MPVVDGEPPVTTVLSFRTYPVRQMVDVTLAAMAVQHEDLFPGLDALVRSQISTIISELGTNIVKYAGTGRILLRSLERGNTAGIEVLSIDQGPGIPNLDQAMEDHFTTGKTLGLGLGSVRRLATDFELHCPESGGTRVRAVCWWPNPSGHHSRSAPPVQAAARTGPRSGRPLRRAPRQADDAGTAEGHCAEDHPLLKFTTLSHNRPALGQRESGDALVVLDHGSLGFRIAIDGAGHGPVAHGLSSRAATLLRQHLDEQIAGLPLTTKGLVLLSQAGLESLMLETASTVHAQTRGSRGVALGMAVFDGQAHRLHYLGIGNTRILKLNWKGWEGVNRDGQLGVSYRRPQVNHYPLSPGDLVVQTSDGVRTSSLRAMRASRPNSELKPERILEELLSHTNFNDDVSILLTQCHA